MAANSQVIVFDVNGTLLDISALEPAMQTIFGTRYTVEQWFSQVVAYAMAETLSGAYRDFAEIAGSVLRMAASARDISLGKDQEEMIRRGMRQLPPFADVKPALDRLRAAGRRLAVLSNSGESALNEQIEKAGLKGFFERVISVESVRRFKPSPQVYNLAARKLEVPNKAILMVAAHPWDLAGAARAGCRTAFISRPGTAPATGLPRPDYVARDLAQFSDQALRTRSSRGRGVSFAAAACGLAAIGIATAAMAGRQSRRG